MNEHRSLVSHVAEWWKTRKTTVGSSDRWRRWVPTPGNIVFTVLFVGILFLTQRTWASDSSVSMAAAGPSATTVNYQGRLAAPDGTPKSGSFGMSFSIWDAATGGSVLWSESHPAVAVADGLFSVGLGSQTSGGIPTSVWNGDRYLEMTVGGETLSPRELIRSVPVAGLSLTSQVANVAASLPVKHVQKNIGGWTVTEPARNFAEELDAPITIGSRSLVFVNYSGNVKCLEANQPRDCYLKIYRDDKLILDSVYTSPGAGQVQALAGQYTEIIDPGTHIYRVYIASSRTGPEYSLYASSFSVLAIPIEQ